MCFLRGHKGAAKSGECSRSRGIRKHGGREATILLLKRWVVAGLACSDDGHGKLADNENADMSAADLEHFQFGAGMVDDALLQRSRTLAKRKEAVKPQVPAKKRRSSK